MSKGIKPTPMHIRFKRYVSIDENGCHVWTGAIKENGYGIFTNEIRKNVYAHRYSYELSTGTKIPDGYVIDHLCKNRACVNPKHLEPVTQQVNLSRGDHPNMIANNNGTCTKGHILNLTNSDVRPDGRLMCRICRNDRRRKNYALKKSIK